VQNTLATARPPVAFSFPLLFNFTPRPVLVITTRKRSEPIITIPKTLHTRACVRERRVVEAVCVSTSKCECVRVAFVLKYKFFSRYTTFTPPLLLLLCALRRRPRHVILFLVMIYARAFLYIRVELQIRTRVYKHTFYLVYLPHTRSHVYLFIHALKGRSPTVAPVLVSLTRATECTMCAQKRHRRGNRSQSLRLISDSCD